MKEKGSNLVREIAKQAYVVPEEGRRQNVLINVGDIKKKLVPYGFPAGNTNQICSSLESEKFTEGTGLVRCTPKNQPRKHSTTYEFRFANTSSSLRNSGGNDPLLALTGKFRNAFKEGADAFLRELRADKDESR